MKNAQDPSSSPGNLTDDAPTLPPADPSGSQTQLNQRDPKDQDLDFLLPAQAPDEMGRLGRYRLLKMLGRGGMGIVFLAEDVDLHRTVAVKAMLPEIARKPTAKERFLREARAAAKLQNDHVVPIYHVGEERGVPFLAMPLLQGCSLEESLRAARGPLPLSQVLKIGREVAEGLACAHGHGLVHRDIKPANLWLDENSGGRVRILDFGLARGQEDPNLTQSGAILGTPAYMAPEQARGEVVDGRADLFSLGVVLYRLSTGQPPFKGADSVSTLISVAADQPPSPRLLNPSIPHNVSELVMKLLAKDRAQRPNSAREVVQTLAALEKSAASPSESTTQSLPPTLPPVSRRRMPWIGIAAGLLLLVLVVALAWGPKRVPSVKQDTPSTEGKLLAEPEEKKQNPGVMPPPPSSERHAFDQLRRENIPARLVQELFGGIDKVPNEVVGVLCPEGFQIKGKGSTTVMAVSPDGSALAMGGAGLEVWEIPSQKRIRELPGRGVAGLRFHQGASRLASVHHSGLYQLWDVSGGHRLRMEPPIEVATNLWIYPWINMFSPDGTQVVISNRDGWTWVRDVDTGAEVTRFQRPKGNQALFSPDGKKLVWRVQEEEGEVYLVLRDLTTGKQDQVEVESQLHRLNTHFYFTPDGQKIRYNNDVGLAVREFDLQTRKGRVLLHTPDKMHTSVGSSDGKRVATANRDGRLRLWEVETKAKLLEVELPGMAEGTGGWSLQFTGADRYLIATHRLAGYVYLIRLPSVSR